MAKKKQSKENKAGVTKLRLASYAGLLTFIVGVWAKDYAATIYDFNSPQITEMNYANRIASVCGYSFVVIGALVAARLAWRYWPFRATFKLKKLDDKQRATRMSVMEWSYRAYGVWALLALITTNLDSDYSRNYIFWMLVAMFFLMPSLVAAHRKDA